jgi:hypothetical protein
MTKQKSTKPLLGSGMVGRRAGCVMRRVSSTRFCPLVLVLILLTNPDGLSSMRYRTSTLTRAPLPSASTTDTVTNPGPGSCSRASRS